eukprot:UN06660
MTQSSCQRNLWGDIWAGAVCRCGCWVRGAVAVHVRAKLCPHTGSLELFTFLQQFSIKTFGYLQNIMSMF